MYNLLYPVVLGRTSHFFPESSIINLHADCKPSAGYSPEDKLQVVIQILC